MPLGSSDLLLYADRSDAIYNITHNFDRNEIKIEGAALNADFSCRYSHSVSAHRVLLNWTASTPTSHRRRVGRAGRPGHFSPVAKLRIYKSRRSRQNFWRWILFSDRLSELCRVLKLNALPSFFDLRILNSALNRRRVYPLRREDRNGCHYLELVAL